MSIYIMNGETFLRDYVDEKPSVVIETQYVIVSQFIRKGGRYENSIINANNVLYPSERLLVDYKPKSKEFKKAYYEQLDESLPFIATLVKAAIEGEMTIVIMCSKKEWKRRYLRLLAKYIREKLNYPVYDYKMVIEGEQEPEAVDDLEVLKLVKQIVNDNKKKGEQKLLSGANRKDYLRTLPKKRLKKMMKKLELPENLSKSDMVDAIDIYYKG